MEDRRLNAFSTTTRSDAFQHWDPHLALNKFQELLQAPVSLIERPLATLRKQDFTSKTLFKKLLSLK